MLITGNSRKFLALEIHCAKAFFAQNDIAKKVFAENSCVELTLLKNFRGNFCESIHMHLTIFVSNLPKGFYQFFELIYRVLF